MGTSNGALEFNDQQPREEDHMEPAQLHVEMKVASAAAWDWDGCCPERDRGGGAPGGSRLQDRNCWQRGLSYRLCCPILPEGPAFQLAN